MKGAAIMAERSPIGSRGNVFRGDRRAVLFGSGLAIRGNSFDLDAELAFELKEVGALFPQEKRGGNAVFTGAAGAADAVDEVFGDIGKVVVDDVGDVLDVDAASGDVGGNEHAILPALETSEGRSPLRLRAVAMNHGGVDALTVQILGDALRAALGARENEAAAAFAFEQVEEHVGFAVFGDFEGLEANTFRGFRSRTKREANGIFCVVAHELRHGAFHRGGEAQSLALPRQHADNAAYGWEEAHVEHAIGFVENKRFDASQ